MMLTNNTSRYHVAATAVRAGGLSNPKVLVSSHSLATKFLHMAQNDKKYILEFGKGTCLVVLDLLDIFWLIVRLATDPDGTFDTPVFN